MNMEIGDFCKLLATSKLDNTKKALAVLWFHDHKHSGAACTGKQLANTMDDHRIGTPNPTLLAKAIRTSRLASESKKNGFSLKPGSRAIINGWLPQQIEGIQPGSNHAAGYIPEAVWSGTRDYVESVARQVNGCFSAAYYDAASVMLRRLMETLVIEAYVYLQRDAEIKGADGNYLMFGELLKRSLDSSSGLNLSRNAKRALEEIKRLGDLSAHNRRFTACAADLNKIEPDARVVTGELMTIACLKNRAK